MKANASIRINLLSQEFLPSLLRALIPEIKKVSNRAKVKIDIDQSMIILNVEAQDTIALRASLNTYLRWISSAIEVLEVIKKRKLSE